jgi:CO/xanthine dehydrogenase Mo-binding subunit
MTEHGAALPGRRIIGTPMPIAEDRRFVRGRGRYINDMQLPDMLHVAVVPAPVAHADVTSVDVSAALGSPGVVTVLTGQDLLERMEPIPQELPLPDIKWYPLVTDKIRYVGEWVAAVVATSRAAAEDAAELVVVTFDELDPVVDPEAALQPGAPILHPAHGSNVVWHRINTWNEVDEAFASAEHTFTYRYRWNRHSGVPLETFGCVAWQQPSGFLDIWASHQNPGIQVEMQDVLRLPSCRVNMDIDVGGSYGSKRGRKQMYITAIAAMVTGKPVKFIEDRIENMQASDGHGPDRVYEFKVAADSSGLITALDVMVIEDLGAYCGRGPRQITKPTSALVGPYRIPAARYGWYGVLTCKTNQVPFRGAGQSPHNYCLERTLDRVARALGLDPIELRFRNYIQPDEFPYEIPSGVVYDSGNYPAATRLAIEKAGLAELRAEQAEARRQGRLMGIGLAGGIEPGGGGILDMGESTRLQITLRGEIIVTLGFQSCGQAHESMVTQIVCEEFGIEPGQVIVQRGHGLDGIVGGAPTGSRMSMMLGTAVKNTTDKLHDKLKQLCAHSLEADAQDIVFNGREYQVAGDDSAKMSLKDLSRLAYGPARGRPADMDPGLVAESFFAGPKGFPKTKNTGGQQFRSYAFDFHIAVVDVDPETFEVSIGRYVVVHDCGTVLNPLVVDGFVYGGIGHGVGGALYEQFVYDENGAPMAVSFMDYLIPTATEIPEVELYPMVTPSPWHPYGAKGTAEGSYMTTPAVLGNAVEDALVPLGVSVSQIPMTPRYLYEAWRAAQPGGHAEATAAPHMVGAEP